MRHLSASDITRLIAVLCFCLISHAAFTQPGRPLNRQQKFIVILGIAQDAGYPQAGCNKDCCKAVWEGKETKKLAVSLGIVDIPAKKIWMIEATPDFKEQLKELLDFIPASGKNIPDGIFLTHAHIGHYTGLINLSMEVMGTKNVPVYAMPRMSKFLTENGPWSQLVAHQNIELVSLQADTAIHLDEDLSITPFLVPHRDEYSETVGYLISTGNKKVLFIPDIDKWSKWKKDIKEEIRKADVALIDGSFFKDGELPGRDMSEIPHPFIEESMALFEDLSKRDKSKVMFIHFNHTNPMNWNSEEKKQVLLKGFRIAQQGQIIGL